MKRIFGKEMASLWTRDLVVLALALFFMRFGEGLLGGARTNFFVDTLGITGGQVLWLEGIREIPGLALIFIAALSMNLPVSHRAAAWAAIMAIGYMTFALVHSYAALLLVAVLASFGTHGFMPLQPVLSMSLATMSTRGRVMGILTSVASLATIIGMGVTSLSSGLFENISLRWSYVIGGVVILVSAVLLVKLPTSIGATQAKQPRMLLSKRYWLYYVLTFFEGSRKQVLNTFGSLMLVDLYSWKTWQISLLMVVSASMNLIASPYLGALADRFGPRRTLSYSYLVLVLCCVGFGIVQTPLILAGLFIIIRMAIILGMGLNMYVHQTAPSEELTPTLSAGISINHVTSVAMPIVAGALLPIINYSGVFLGTAALIAMSIPFALAMRHGNEPEPVMEVALAK